MHLIFSNPAGWWALLGIPALVIIHILQRKSRQVDITTMFLLEKQDVESRAGRRLERWRSSRLFWLQVLAVLLISWMLSEPRWVENGTMQRVALVLDSSLAMDAFRPQLQKGLDADTATLARGASRTEWLLLESDLTRPPLYRGEDRAALLDALNNWHANLGPHDPAPVLRAARVAVGNDGLIFFVTYHPAPNGPLPVEAHVLAYGHVLDNVGIGAAVAETHDGQGVWRVFVHNYAATPQKRTWWIESGAQKSPAQSVELAPGASTALQGAFPPNATHVVFALSPDDFTLDDRCPLVLPQPKQLALLFRGPDDFAAYLKPITQVIDGIGPTMEGTTPDLLFDLGGNLAFTPQATSRVYFTAQEDSNEAASVHAHPAVEKNSLMDGLNWAGLLYTSLPPLPRRREDITLMWDGSQPLIFLRQLPGQGPVLVLNFDPRHSNLTRLPAFVLLIDRFAEMARMHKAAFARQNFPSGEQLSLVLPHGALGAKLENTPMSGPDAGNPKTTTLSAVVATQSRAPSPPAFFTIKVDDKLWLDGASQFPDPRESDFHDAAAIPLEAKAQVAREEAHSHPDSLTPLWLLTLLGVLLATWRETARNLK